MYLPGTINERIGDLRTSKGFSQKKLAEMIEVAPSQLSRIESGETRHISSDILIKLAKAFGVSADYILGLTKISAPKSYEISELGLSEGAVKAMVTGKIDVQILNQLIEHKTFPYLLYLIKAYFDDSMSVGIMARNDVINMATAAIGDFVKEHPKHKTEAQGDLRYLRSEKLGDHEAEREKVKATFMAILNDIKKSIEDGNEPKVPATSEFLRQMWEQVQVAQQGRKAVTVDDITAAMMSMIGQIVALDEKGRELFRQLAEHLLAGV